MNREDNETGSVFPAATDDMAEAETWFERFFGRPSDANPMPVLREWHTGLGGSSVFEHADKAATAL